MSENIDSIMMAFAKDYSGKLHVREIARVTGMNRQTVSETLKKMEDSRILDSEIEGRNKLYFISGNTKSKILMENAENMKKLDVCARKTEISRLISYLDSSSVALLFGSYAKSSDSKESDIDILLIGKGGKNFSTFEKETGREIQVFVMSERQFLEKLASKDHLVVEAIKDHVCLKNTEKFVDLMWRANYG